MAQNRRAIDPDLFTDAQGAAELEANSLRESLSYDAYGTETEYTVVVLTKPIPMSSEDAATVFSGDGTGDTLYSANPLEGGISFKGRIIGNGFISPHASLPNPCNLDAAQDAGTVVKVINMHTTFVSVNGYQGRIPNIGDTVIVKLQAGDIKLNLQSAVFTEVFDAANSSQVANTMATSCSTLASRFNDFDPDTDLGDLTFSYASFDYEGPNIPPITEAQAKPLVDQISARLDREPSLLGYTKLPPGKCGIPSDFFGATPSAAEKALIDKYPVQDCVTEQVGRTINNKSASLTGHPVFISTLKQIYSSAKSQSWWEKHVAENGNDPICFKSPYRSIEKQIYLRMGNCGHRSFEEVMSAPTKPVCKPPTARPGKSRHNLGLAIDFAGTIGASFTSEAHKWLITQGLRGNSTYAIKNYQKEAWHWSIDGS